MLPPLPTDNLYKFMALSGLALFCFGIWLPIQMQDTVTPELTKAKIEMCVIQADTEKLIGRDKQNSGLEGPFDITPDHYLNLTTDEKQFKSYREFYDKLDEILSTNCQPNTVFEKLSQRAKKAKSDAEGYRIPAERDIKEAEKYKSELQLLKKEYEKQTNKDIKLRDEIDELETKIYNHEFSAQLYMKQCEECLFDAERFKSANEIKSQIDIAQGIRIKLRQHLITLENLWRLSRKEKIYFWGSIIGSVFGLLLGIGGFYLWHKRVQIYQDKMIFLQSLDENRDKDKK
ncbi:MAG TPA: hypothetical protein VIH42_02770 [Thermoguttaceae bacterium]